MSNAEAEKFRFCELELEPQFLERERELAKKQGYRSAPAASGA
jgi:hypothetical protein